MFVVLYTQCRLVLAVVMGYSFPGRLSYLPMFIVGLMFSSVIIH